jgi:hypothetical protein
MLNCHIASKNPMIFSGMPSEFAITVVSKFCKDSNFECSLQGVEPHYIFVSEETLKQAIDKYTRWLDNQISETFASVDQNVDEAGI